MEPPKFKVFNHSSWTHEIFKVGKYEEKIKFGSIIMGGSLHMGLLNF